MNLRLIYPHVACALVALAQCGLYADGMTRSLEPVAGGCKVTLAWEFSGKIESDLVIEERFAQGWAVADSTVPFGSLDASWFSGSVARFAVKPSLLGSAGSISFTVVCGESTAAGNVAGDWKMYCDGALRKGAVTGESVMSALADGVGGGCAAGGAAEASGTGSMVETAVAVKSFKVVAGGIELGYSGVTKAGTLVVEGCEGLGKSWKEVARATVPSGDGKVSVKQDNVGTSRFFRMKLLTVEE